MSKKIFKVKKIKIFYFKYEIDNKIEFSYNLISKHVITVRLKIVNLQNLIQLIFILPIFIFKIYF